MNLDTIFQKKEDIVSRRVSDEYILVPLSDDIADMDSLYTMNEVGAYIWEQIDGNRSINKIIENITNEFDVNEEVAKEDTVAFLKNILNFLR